MYRGVREREGDKRGVEWESESGVDVGERER
jgi:hypothetical protein